jgi:hypothetical protein
MYRDHFPSVIKEKPVRYGTGFSFKAQNCRCGGQFKFAFAKLSFVKSGGN